MRPWAGLLEGGRCAWHGASLTAAPRDVQSDEQPLAGEPAGIAGGWLTREVEGTGEVGIASTGIYFLATNLRGELT